jgi:pimeloyl-ACP methyl ester carboxylesterase
MDGEAGGIDGEAGGMDGEAGRDDGEVLPLRWVRLGALHVPYLEIGDHRGPPVVLLPGLSDGLAPITRASARRTYTDVPLPLERIRGIVVSHRSTVTSEVTTRQLAEDIGSVLEVVLDEPAVVVAHSMGGMVAQHLAADRPELVSGLVLTASSARPDDAVRDVLARWDALLIAHRFEAFARDAVATSFTGAVRRDRERLLALDPPPPPPTALIPRHLALSRACATHDAVGRLATIEHPALVVAGADDEVIPSRQSEALAAGLAQARFVGLDGVGHGFPEQDRQRYMDHVVPFVTDLSAG